MKNTPKANQAIIASRYWRVLSAVAGVVALSPLAILLVIFAANPSSNPFDGGAVIWVFFLTVPTGGIIFAVGALAAVAIEWFAGRKPNRSR